MADLLPIVPRFIFTNPLAIKTASVGGGVLPMVAKSALLGSVLGIVAIVLVLVSMFSFGWYKATYEEEFFGLTADMSFSLGEVRVEMGDEKEDTELDDDLGKLSDATMTLLILGLVMASVFLILGILGAFGVGGGMLRLVPMVIGLIAGIIVVVAAVYYAVGFMGAFEHDTGLSEGDIEGFQMSVGYSVYLALFGGILCIAGAVMTVQRKAPATMANMPVTMFSQNQGTSQYPQQYPGQPSQQYPGQPGQQYPGQSPQQYPGQPPQQRPPQY